MADDKISMSLEKWKKPLIVMMGVFLLGGAVWIGWNQWQSYQERHAVSSLYLMESELQHKKEEVAKVTSKNTEKTQSPESFDFNKTYGDIVHRFQQTILKYQGSKAALVAAMDLANFYVEFHQVNQALDLLSQLGQVHAETLEALISLQRATLKMDQQDFREALSLLETISSQKKFDFLHAEALVKAGLCYQKLGQFDRAQETFTRVSMEFSDTEASRSAKGYLRLLQLQQRGDSHKDSKDLAKPKG